MKHSSHTYEIIVNKDDKIVLPPALQMPAVEWYHTFLCHPGETRLEMTLRQHYDWRGLRTHVVTCNKACRLCKQKKAKKGPKYGKLPAKRPETEPWHTLCIDLIGPYKIGGKKKEATLWCLTMIDPATGWFDIVSIVRARADFIANYLEINWLTRYPWPTEIVMDRGREFAAELSESIKDECGINKKLITTRNPQANAIVERVHQTVHNMLRVTHMIDSDDCDSDFGFDGILASVRRAVNATVHTTLRATPTQLVFGRDALLNIAFQADWEQIKERKQKLILKNNARENASRRDYTYTVGQEVCVKQQPNRKHGAGTDRYTGPYTVSQVNDNGTVQLSRATTRGAVYQTWNIRNIDPYMA